MSRMEEVEPVVMEDSDSEEDFSGMPELCDNEKKEQEVEKEQLKEQKKSEKEAQEVAPAPVVDADGWEDVLGSGRLRKKVLQEGRGEEKPGKGSR